MFVWFDNKPDEIGFQIYSFSTFDRIKKWDENVSEKNAEIPYFTRVSNTERTINLYAIAWGSF